MRVSNLRAHEASALVLVWPHPRIRISAHPRPWQRRLAGGLGPRQLDEDVPLTALSPLHTKMRERSAGPNPPFPPLHCPPALILHPSPPTPLRPGRCLAAGALAAALGWAPAAPGKPPMDLCTEPRRLRFLESVAGSLF